MKILPQPWTVAMEEAENQTITGFITIDAKSYPSQIEDALTFLSQMRNAIQAAGYEYQVYASIHEYHDFPHGGHHPRQLAKFLSMIRGFAATSVCRRAGLGG